LQRGISFLHCSPPFNDLFSSDYDRGVQEEKGDRFTSKYLARLNKKKIKLQKSDIDYIISLYDNGIAYVDKCIGDLFEMLKSMNLFDNSLIIITADHGEEFQEHGYMLHDNPYYYEEIVRVPLVVKLPKAHTNLKNSGEGLVVDGLVESIDIMPTILDLLAIEGPKMQGKSLKELISGNGRGKEYVFGFGLSGSLFIRTDRWKLVNDSGVQKDRFKLFDLHNDPAEQINLVGWGLEIENKLKRKLNEKIEMSMELREDLLLHDGERDDKEVLLTPEEKEKLRALGYLE